MSDSATWAFIDSHTDDDVCQLALQKNKYKNINFDFALRQIQGRQKAKLKLPFLYANPGVLYPQKLSLEQCSSEKTARYKASLLKGNTLADLSGGFGVDTMAFAQTFKQCFYVEPQAELCDLARHNFDLLGLGNIEIAQDTLEDFVQRMPAVDAIYVDPSRRDINGQRVVGLEQCSPDLTQCYKQLLDKAPNLMVKASPMVDIKRTLAQFPEICELHVVAVDGECRELLFIFQQQPSETVNCHAVNLLSDGQQSLDFSIEDELQTELLLANEVQRFLYEPNAAILKTGAFKTVAQRFAIAQLHTHTHLYTSDKYVPNFPGRTFEVDAVFQYDKVGIKQLTALRKANVAVRNFPLSADELRRQLKLLDGGAVYIFGATLGNSRKVVVQCHKFFAAKKGE